MSQQQLHEIKNLISSIFNHFPVNVHINGIVLEKVIKSVQILRNDQLFVQLNRYWLSDPEDDWSSLSDSEVKSAISKIPLLELAESRRCSDYKDINVQWLSQPVKTSVLNTPNCWMCDYKLLNVNISVIIHLGFVHEYNFDCRNFSLTKSGLTIIQSDDNEHFDGIATLLSLRGIINNHASLINGRRIMSKLKNDKETLFDIVHRQNQLWGEGKKIQIGLDTVSPSSNEKCSICYDTISQKPLYRLVCSHIFCFDCIDAHQCATWLQHNNKCPICRKNLEVQIKQSLYEIEDISN